MKKILEPVINVVNSVDAIIAKNNKEFRGLPKNKKRIWIAKDAIARLLSSQYTASTGNWVDFGYKPHFYDEEGYGKTESLQKAIIDNQVTCDVCGLGALLVSTCVAKNNAEMDDVYELDMNEVNGGNDIVGIKKVFSNIQLQMIEVAFEKGRGLYNLDRDGDTGVFTGGEKLFYKCTAFGRRFKSPKNRLLAILNNIVENKGDFTP